MKVIIAGSRTINSYESVCQAIRNSQFDITEVVSGTARGVDQMGERWAAENNIPVKRFPANWNEYGKKAGYLRNKEMAEYAQSAIILWDCESKGTRHMIQLARRYGLTVFIDF